MQSCAAKGKTASRWLTWLALLLVGAGCNLDVTQHGATPSFEGPPVIHIAAPRPNQTFLAGTTVILQARVENAGPDLARISVLLDEALLGERLNPNETNASVLPLTIDWPTSNPGQFTLSVTAERADGSIAREDVNVVVIDRSGAPSTPTLAPGQADEATAAPATEEAPTNDSASDLPAVEDATMESPPPLSPPSLGESGVPGLVIQPSNLRLGPATAYELVGSLANETAVTIVAVDPTGEWYRITYADSGDAWIYSELVEPADDASGLPVETGVPPSSEGGVNLVVSAVEIEPSTPVCEQATAISATIQNTGSLDAANVGLIGWAVLLRSNGQTIESETAAVMQSLAAGETATIPFSDTFILYPGEEQRLQVTIDSGDLVLETDEADNTGGVDFTLAPGSC